MEFQTIPFYNRPEFYPNSTRKGGRLIPACIDFEVDNNEIITIVSLCLLGGENDPNSHTVFQGPHCINQAFTWLEERKVRCLIAYNAYYDFTMLRYQFIKNSIPFTDFTNERPQATWAFSIPTIDGTFYQGACILRGRYYAIEDAAKLDRTGLKNFCQYGSADFRKKASATIEAINTGKKRAPWLGEPSQRATPQEWAEYVQYAQYDTLSLSSALQGLEKIVGDISERFDMKNAGIWNNGSLRTQAAIAYHFLKHQVGKELAVDGETPSQAFKKFMPEVELTEKAYQLYDSIRRMRAPAGAASKLFQENELEELAKESQQANYEVANLRYLIKRSDISILEKLTLAATLSYRGGLVCFDENKLMERIVPQDGEIIQSWDVTSEYPSMMKDRKFPIFSSVSSIKSGIGPEGFPDSSKYCIFTLVSFQFDTGIPVGYFPMSSTLAPTLQMYKATRHKRRLRSSGYRFGWLSWEEFTFLQAEGIIQDFTVHEWIATPWWQGETVSPFTNYIELLGYYKNYFNDSRNQHPKGSEKWNYFNACRNFIKILLNASYGKFASKPGKEVKYLGVEDSQELPSYKMKWMPVGCMVTAWARQFIFYWILKVARFGKFIYTDTDSIKLLAPPDFYQIIEAPIAESKFSTFKIETLEEPIHALIVHGTKMYFYSDDSGPHSVVAGLGDMFDSSQCLIKAPEGLRPAAPIDVVPGTICIKRKSFKDAETGRVIILQREIELSGTLPDDYKALWAAKGFQHL